MHAERYLSLIEGKVDFGPAFKFPDANAQPCGTVHIEDIQFLDHHFSGWKASEIPERTPIVALVEDGFAVSFCFAGGVPMPRQRLGLKRQSNFVDVDWVRELLLRGHWQFEHLAARRCTVRHGPMRPP